MRIVIVSLLILFLTSCENKMLNQLHNKQDFYAHLQQTQRITLSKDDNTKAILSVTYLHSKEYLKYKSSRKQKEDGERFIIGIFFEDNNSSLSMDLNNSYSIRLGRKIPKDIKELSINDNILENIPMVNNWSKYYLVTFAYKPRKRFNFVFSHQEYGTKRIKFYKVAKYLFKAK